jgi:hypothetical protein
MLPAVSDGHEHALLPEVGLADVVELPPWSEAQTRVFVALRPMSFFHATDGAAVLAQRSLPLLVEAAAIHLDGAIGYLTAEALAAWGIGPDALFEVARANVVLRLEHVLEPAVDEEPPRLFRCTTGDAFEGSRLASLPLLARLREALGATTLLLAAPERDTLLVAAEPSPPVLLRLADLAEQVYRGSARPISPALYVFTEEGDLGPLELVDDHPLRARVRKGHLLLADAEYAAQKQALERELADEGVDLFVATHFAVEREGGAALSYATWSEGASALVPHVDLVVLASLDEARPPLVVPWEVALGLVPDLWEEVPGLDPPRRRTLGFPSEEQLAALAEYAVAFA